MKPFTAGKSLASMLLRIIMIWHVYINYFNTFTGFELKSLAFYFAAIYVVFSLLLFIGGFLRKPSVSIISGLVLFLLPIVQVIRAFPENPETQLLNYLIPATLGFFFLTHGNSD